MSSRLQTALDDGAIVLPDTGTIGVFRPSADLDLSALPKDRVQIIQGFKPDYDAYENLGFSVATQAQGRFAASMVCLPRAKEQARDLIATACALSDGAVWIDGQKTDGVESVLRDIKKRTSVGAVISKAHGKIFAFDTHDFSDWAGRQMIVEGFHTAPGVFSADGIDPGSRFLSQSLPSKLTGKVADLGAGWGYLSAQILRHSGVSELHLIEAEHAALECARQNISDERAQFHWADARAFTTGKGFDAVVMNPPFHQGRASDTGLGKAFIASAARILAPHGRLWMVANRHLPYESTAAELFRTVSEVAGDNKFKIILAEKPRRSRS